MNKRNSGFSLIELMVTLAIAGIILTAALPSMTDAFTQNRISNGVRNISKDLVYARTMAISNQTQVVICNLSGTTCQEDKWSEGYTIFLDTNGDGAFDSATESKLRVNNDFEYGELSLDNGADEVIFGANGRVNASAIFTYCPHIKKTYARGVVINGMGRAKMTEDIDGDSLDETSPGDDDSHLTCN